MKIFITMAMALSITLSVSVSADNGACFDGYPQPKSEYTYYEPGFYKDINGEIHSYKDHPAYGKNIDDYDYSIKIKIK